MSYQVPVLRNVPYSNGQTLVLSEEVACMYVCLST